MDAYQKGLNGAQAAWASKKYHGHRVIPMGIMKELDKAGIAWHESEAACLMVDGCRGGKTGNNVLWREN